MPRCWLTGMIAAFGVALSFMAIGCGGDDASLGDDSVDGDGGIGCLEDLRAESYSANMQHLGLASIYTFVLEASEPAPPVKGSNTWTVQITDESDAPVTGALVTVTPFMPDHGHGTSVVPQVSEADDAYTIAPLYLFMPGLWEITIHAESEAVSDSAKFSFCIQG